MYCIIYPAGGRDLSGLMAFHSIALVALHGHGGRLDFFLLFPFLPHNLFCITTFYFGYTMYYIEVYKSE